MNITKQFSKYGSVAIGSAITDYFIFSLLLFLNFTLLQSQIFARVSGGLFSFLINKYWSFGTKNKGIMLMEGRRFAVLYIASYILTISIFYFLTTGLELAAYSGKIISDSIGFIFNYIAMKLYVFSGARGIRSILTLFLSRFRKPS